MSWWQGSLVEMFGWTLVHSLWEILGIAVVAEMLLMAMRRAPANGRYWMCCVMMALMAAAPVATPGWLTAKAAPVRMPSDIVVPLVARQMTFDGVGPVVPRVTNIAAVQQAPRHVDWKRTSLRCAVLAYLIGAAVLTLRLLGGYWRLRRLRRNATLADAMLRERLATLMKRWGMKHGVELVASALVEVPTLVGFFRPVILLPLTVTSGLSAEQVSALIAHELAHVRRWDFLVNAMQSVIETLLFYHPAVWWISRRIRQEREHCCDDLVVSLGTSRVAYAKALTEMESLRPATAFAMAANSTSLLPRIRRILQVPSPSKNRRSIGLLATIMPAIVLVALLVIVACKRNTSTTPAETQPASATTQAATDAEDQYTISLETRVMLVSSRFFDNVATDWKMTVPSGTVSSAASSSAAPSATRPADQSLNIAGSILDNWTLDMLIKAAQADENALIFDHPRVTVAERQEVRISSKDAGVVLPEGFEYSWTVSSQVSQDGRYAVLSWRDDAVTKTTMVSVPDGGTLLLGGQSVEGNRFALFLVRPRIHPPKSLVAYERTQAQKAQFERTKAQKAAATDLKVRQRLEENIDVIQFNQAPFYTVIDYLRDHTQTNIFVNWTALSEAGIIKNTPVSVNLRNVPFRKVLHTIFSDINGNTVRLDYAIDDGVITISTHDDLESAKYQVVRVYDIRDLLMLPDTNDAPSFGADLEATTTGGTTSGGQLFSGNSESANTAERPTARDIARDISDVIQTTVAPGSWVNNGGAVGTIKELNGQLIITQTVENQTAIDTLLQQLRESHALQIAIEANLYLVDDATFQKLNLPRAKNGDAVSNTFDVEQVKKFIKVIEESPTTVTVSAPRVTLFNGYPGYIAMTEQMNYIGNASCKVDEKGAINSEHTIDTLTYGLILNLEGTASVDRKSVVLKVKPSLRQLVKIETSPVLGAPAGKMGGGEAEFVIQKPVLREAEMTTLCSVLDNHTLVMGGMMVKDALPGIKGESVKDLQDEKSPGRQLIVMVKPRIVVQKEIETRP
ncbi:MAG: hypothetical protein FWD61_08365 [Phycisphaerales bacterium]|nr:hypothetical protein [Phycisphaerales bacterium]